MGGGDAADAVRRRASPGTIVVAGTLLLAFTLWRPLIDERLAAKSVVAQANVDSREAYWSAAARMAADHPILGVGPGRFGIESKNYILNDPINIERPVVHNSYLEVLAEGGVPTLIAFIALIFGSWRLLARARVRFQVSETTSDGLRIVAATQASLVVAIVSANFLSVQITIPLWLLAGIAAVLWYQAAPPQRRVKVALVTSIPYGGPVEHAVLLARDLVAPRRLGQRGGVPMRRSPRGSPRAARGRRCCRCAAPATGRARCACTGSCAARTWSTPTTAAAGCGCGSGRRTARCACTRCTGCRSRTSTAARA